MPRDPAVSAIEAFRRATTCAPELRDTNWAAVQARVSGAERVLPDAPRVRSSTRIWVVAGIALAATVAAVWWGASGWSGARVVADRDAAEQAIDAPVPAVSGGRAQTVPATPPESPRSGPPSASATPSPIVPRDRPAPGLDVPAVVDTPEAPRAPAVVDDPLGREAQLIASGRAALGRGALEDAAAAIDRHAREFPDGTMGPERMALAVRLQCARRDLPAARAAAASYLRAHPGSSLARRLAASPCSAEEKP